MPERSFSRRRFLQSAGAALGALAAPIGLSEAAAAERAPIAAAGISGVLPRLGLLLPDAAPAALIDQLRLGLQTTSARSRSALSLQTASFGAQPADQAALRLLDQGAELLLVLGGPAYLAPVDALLATTQRSGLAIGMAATLPRADEPLSSLLAAQWPLWGLEYALGAWAAQALGRRAVVGTAAYESGFDAPYAFWAGFESAGGAVVDYALLDAPGQAPSVAALNAAVARARPDVVYVAASGSPAQACLAAWPEWQRAGAQLLLPATVAGSGLLQSAGANAAGIILAQPQGLPTATSRWTQLGLALRGVLDQLSAQALVWSAPAQVRQALRGALATSGLSTHQQLPAATITQVVARTGSLRSQILAQVAAQAGLPAPLAAFQQQMRTGWITPYLA